MKIKTLKQIAKYLDNKTINDRPGLKYIHIEDGIARMSDGYSVFEFVEDRSADGFYASDDIKKYLVCTKDKDVKWGDIPKSVVDVFPNLKEIWTKVDVGDGKKARMRYEHLKKIEILGDEADVELLGRYIKGQSYVGRCLICGVVK